MNDEFRAPKVVSLTPGRPHVPDPHEADYSAPVPEEAYLRIDELCPQTQFDDAKTVKRFEW